MTDKFVVAVTGGIASGKTTVAKLFETLMKQGEQFQDRTKRAATETATVAREAATAKAKEMQQMAGGTWDKLEQVFEDRVARALSKLGVYTQNDVARLAERVDALSDAVNELIKAGGRGAVPGRPAKTAGRATQKRAAKKASASSAQATRTSEPATESNASAPRKRAKRRAAKKS